MNTHTKEAAKAHTNLNMWGAVKALLESGVLYGGRTHKPARQIIVICEKEMQKELRIYDREVINSRGDG